MGTKAVFAVKSKTPNKHYTTIIGMTIDGSQHNLISIAREAKQIATELRCKTAFRKNEWSAVSKVFTELIKRNKGWLFTDQISNASWVSWSAIYDPKKDLISMYQNNLDYKLYDYNIATNAKIT